MPLDTSNRSREYEGSAVAGAGRGRAKQRKQRLPAAEATMYVQYVPSSPSPRRKVQGYFWQVLSDWTAWSRLRATLGGSTFPSPLPRSASGWGCSCSANTEQLLLRLARLLLSKKISSLFFSRPLIAGAILRRPQSFLLLSLFPRRLLSSSAPSVSHSYSPLAFLLSLSLLLDSASSHSRFLLPFDRVLVRLTLSCSCAARPVSPSSQVMFRCRSVSLGSSFFPRL